MPWSAFGQQRSHGSLCRSLCVLSIRDLWEIIEPDPASGLCGAQRLRRKDSKAAANIKHLEERHQLMVDDMELAKAIWTLGAWLLSLYTPEAVPN
jgi:hypothetical protein